MSSQGAGSKKGTGDPSKPWLMASAPLAVLGLGVILGESAIDGPLVLLGFMPQL